MDAGENFFVKIRIISLSRPKPIGSALRRAGPKNVENPNLSLRMERTQILKK